MSRSDQTPSVTVRDAVATDAPLIAGWNAAMALETEEIALDPAVVGAGVAAALADETGARGRYFLAELGPAAGSDDPVEVVGQLMITTEWSDWRNRWFWWIQSVYVTPQGRGQGVFTALYRHVEQLAQNPPDGADPVAGLRLYVEPHNDRARRTYERLGMVVADYQMMEVDWVLGR